MNAQPRYILLPFIATLLFTMVNCDKEEKKEPVEKAALTTIPAYNITTNTAQSGGNITSDGGGEITSRGVLWSISPLPSMEQNNGRTIDGKGKGDFMSSITELEPYTTYYLRAYATNQAGIMYGNEHQFKSSGFLPTVATNPVTDISVHSVTLGGNVIDQGTTSITFRGVVWSTLQNPSLKNNIGRTINGKGVSEFVDSITGLTPNTAYYVRAYATSSIGTAYGEQLSFTTLKDNTIVVEVTNPSTGRVWMDRNMGASNPATNTLDNSAYGHYYQWGRAADGHQLRSSGTTSTVSFGDTPGHGNFILNGLDWRSPQEYNLWQGVNGKNNPCPSGFRLPTEAELNAERLSWSSNNAAGAFASPLKLPAAGDRSRSNGMILTGHRGAYWSSNINGTNSRYLHFYSTSGSNADIYNSARAQGYSVRCIKD